VNLTLGGGLDCRLIAQLPMGRALRCALARIAGLDAGGGDATLDFVSSSVTPPVRISGSGASLAAVNLYEACLLGAFQALPLDPLPVPADQGCVSGFSLSLYPPVVDGRDGTGREVIAALDAQGGAIVTSLQQAIPLLLLSLASPPPALQRAAMRLLGGGGACDTLASLLCEPLAALAAQAGVPLSRLAASASIVTSGRFALPPPRTATHDNSIPDNLYARESLKTDVGFIGGTAVVLLLFLVMLGMWIKGQRSIAKREREQKVSGGARAAPLVENPLLAGASPPAYGRVVGRGRSRGEEPTVLHFFPHTSRSAAKRAVAAEGARKRQEAAAANSQFDLANIFGTPRASGEEVQGSQASASAAIQ
jgi:hypothetical protein